MTSARKPTIALLVVLGLAGFTTLCLRARSTAGIDFYQMWIGARMARETRDFYAPATRARMGEHYLRLAESEEQSPRRSAVARHRRDLEVLSTPFLYTIYAPLRGTYERDLLIFQAIVFAAMIGWVVLLARTYGYDLTLALALFALLVLAFEPTRSDARVANMNHVMLLMIAIAAALTSRKKFLLAGAVIALAVLTKPYVILILPLTYAFWMVKRRWRDVAVHATGAAIAGAAGLIVSSLYFRSATIWLDWLRAFRAMPRAMVSPDLGNIALARLIEDAWGIDLSFALMIVFAAIAVGAATRAKSAENLDQSAIVLGCVVFQLGSPLVWVHHLLLSVPLLAWLLRPTESRARVVVAALAFALLAVEPWAIFVPTMMHVAALVNVGLLIAYAAALFDL